MRLLEIAGFLGIVILMHSALAEAAPRYPLELGIGFGQVRQIWGPPADKAELESQRLVRWYYPGGEAVFHEGKLQSWRSDAFKPASEPTVVPVAAQVPQPRRRTPVGTLNDDQVQGLLEEVVKQGGGGDPTSVTMQGLNNGAIVPQPPSFLVPTPFGFNGGFPGRLTPP